MTTRITILCENSVARPGGLIAEHGFAALIETPQDSVLFDTGQGFGLINNAREIGRNLSAISTVVLSHGHSDHTGGMPALLEHLQRPMQVVAHPDVFTARYWRSNFELRPIGMVAQRAELEGKGARFSLCCDYKQMSENLYSSGEVPRRTDFEKGDPHLVIADGHGGYCPDSLRDDLSLAITTSKGLVILLGCAHAGVINIVEHFREKSGEERICALIGGTHLGPASEEQFQATLNKLKSYRLGKIGLSHCTGLNRGAQLFQEFAGRSFYAAAGTVLEFV
ncbi:MAG: MBL fold metallo-hydrolase [Desulfuromonadales bacterium]|nr:MBL fold metallo-hydrolase [Desulfuromonadales bacterium]